MEPPHEKQGIENPRIIDCIASNKESVTLHLYAGNPWKNSREEMQILEDKLNRYLGYVLDGFLAKEYPQYKNLPITFQLDCVEPPHGFSAQFFEKAADFVIIYDIHLNINSLPADRIPTYILTH